MLKQDATLVSSLLNKADLSISNLWARQSHLQKQLLRRKSSRQETTITESLNQVYRTHNSSLAVTWRRLQAKHLPSDTW